GLHHGDRRLHDAGDYGRQQVPGHVHLYRPAIPHSTGLSARRDQRGGADAVSGGAVDPRAQVRGAPLGNGAMKQAVVTALLTAAFVFLLAPIVVVVISSFNAVGVLSFPPHSFTTRWYAEIDPSYYRALTVSLILASITVVIAVAVGVPGALALARGRFPGRDALNAICLSPLMVPALVMGVAAFQFSLAIWDHFHLTLGGTIVGLVVGHLTFAIPFVVRAVLAGHTRFDHSVEEAA